MTFAGVMEAVTRGEAQQAFTYYVDKANELEARADTGEAAKAHRAAALVAFRLGRHQAEIRHGLRALQLVENAPPTSTTLEIRLSAHSMIAHGYRIAGDLDQAQHYFQHGLALAGTVGEREAKLYWSSLFLRGLAGLDIVRRNFVRGIGHMQQGLPLIEALLADPRSSYTLRARRSLSYTTVWMGRAHLEMGELNVSEAWFRRAVEVATAADLPETRVDGLAGLGYVALARSDYAGARGKFEEARDVARRFHDSQQSAYIDGGIGEAFAGQGRHEDALLAFRRSMDRLEAQRGELQDARLRGSFLEDKQRIYQGAVLSAHALGRPGDAFTYAERSRARAFLDLLGDDVTLPKPQAVRLPVVEPLTAAAVQALVPPGAALLEYLITDHAILIWVVDRNAVHAVSVPIRRAELVDEIRTFRRAISEGAELPLIQTQARRLYALLIGPAQAFLVHDRFLIVPHDVLHYLPFAALQTADGRWLADAHTVAVLPSASAMRYLGRSKAAAAPPLAVGDPVLAPPALRLPYAQDEVQIVRARYPTSTVLIGRAATEAAVKRRSAQPRILHFATHAELTEQQPLSSALLLTPGRGEDGRLEVREIFGLPLEAHLVVLSACETALGQLSRGDEIVGFQRAFLSAGARTIVSTLWTVDDVATYELMEAFYAKLEPLGPARALRSAQRVVMKRFAHPYFWAAFTVTGLP